MPRGVYFRSVHGPAISAFAVRCQSRSLLSVLFLSEIALPFFRQYLNVYRFVSSEEDTTIAPVFSGVFFVYITNLKHFERERRQDNEV